MPFLSPASIVIGLVWDVFDDSKEFHGPQVSNGLKVISNESMDFNDPKKFYEIRHTMIQRELQLKVWIMIILNPSSMVLFHK